MVLVHPELRADGGLLVRDRPAPGSQACPSTSRLASDVDSGDRLRRRPVPGRRRRRRGARLVQQGCSASPCGWCYADDPTRRPANLAFTGPDVPMAFADGYPLHLTTRGVAGRPERRGSRTGPMADQGPLPMVRFRPNLVVSGRRAVGRGRLAAAADRRRRLPLGQGLRRCAIPTTDPSTAVRVHEPTATLAEFRRWDGAVWFGMNLVPRHPGRDDPRRRRGRGAGVRGRPRRSAALVLGGQRGGAGRGRSRRPRSTRSRPRWR